MDYKAGVLQPHYNSEDLPEAQPDQYLTKVVSHNLQAFV